MLVLIGGSAMSAFRVEALLNRCPELSQLSARTVYFVDGKLIPESTAQLQELLAAELVNDISAELITVPRAGTVSPWASKATDIAHNCGLHDVLRIERGTAWFADQALNDDSQSLFYDRMTEMVLAGLHDAEVLFIDKPPAPLLEIDVLGGGVEQLQKDNITCGFALSGDEIEYLVESFTKLGRCLLYTSPSPRD